jgi:hypothetical protein
MGGGFGEGSKKKKYQGQIWIQKIERKKTTTASKESWTSNQLNPKQNYPHLFVNGK